jgi:3-oxoacyl-[acyl-carrier-protein] synthase III
MEDGLLYDFQLKFFPSSQFQEPSILLFFSTMDASKEFHEDDRVFLTSFIKTTIQSIGSYLKPNPRSFKASRAIIQKQVGKETCLCEDINRCCPGYVPVYKVATQQAHPGKGSLYSPR